MTFRWEDAELGNHILKPMQVWQTLLFASVPAILVYIAQWVIAPAVSAVLNQPYLIAYLICWGTTEACFLTASLLAYGAEGNLPQWELFIARYRLTRPRKADVVWSFVVLALMLITYQVLAFTAQWLASIPAFSPHPSFPAELTPNALASIVPGMFMGMSLKGAWWLVVLYMIGWVFNILGEELWYRGFMLPRQEVAHTHLGWLANGLSFWFLHIVWKWNLIALLPGSLILSYVAQRQKTTSVGIIAHGVLNFSPILAIAAGVLGL